MLVAVFISLSMYQSYLKNQQTQINDFGEQIIDRNVERWKITGEKNHKQFDSEVLQHIDSNSNISKNYTVISPRVEMPVNKRNLTKLAHKRQIWISMALCFSKNSEMYRKKNYPYAQVTPLAILLWYHFFPDIRILLYLVYDKYELKERRKLYEEQLKQTNVEIRWVEEGDLDCVTKSQLIRMWAFQEPMIDRNDIIVTVDVNLFVVSPKILDPIYKYPDKKVWVFGWYDTSFIE